MLLCGVCLAGFTSTTLLDVVTREIGHPLLWLQEVTSAFFIYGIFVGTAVATRRNDHLYLSAMTEAMTGATRRLFEVFNRAVVLLVGLSMVVFRLAELPHRLRQLPHAVDAADRLSLRADPALRRAGRAVQPRADRQRPAQRLRRTGPPTARPGLTGRCRTASSSPIMTALFLTLGYLGVPVAFALIAGVLVGTLFTPITLQSIIGAVVQRRRFRSADGDPVLPAGRRADDLGQRRRSASPSCRRRWSAISAAAWRRSPPCSACSSPACRARPRPTSRCSAAPWRRPMAQRRLRAGLRRRADRRRLHHRQPGAAQHHGGGVWRDRQRLDRRAVPGRHRAGADGRLRPDDLLLLLRPDRVPPPALQLRQSRRRHARRGAADDDPGDPARRHHDRLVHADRGRRDRRRLYPAGGHPVPQPAATCATCRATSCWPG